MSLCKKACLSIILLRCLNKWCSMSNFFLVSTKHLLKGSRMRPLGPLPNTVNASYCVGYLITKSWVEVCITETRRRAHIDAGKPLSSSEPSLEEEGDVPWPWQRLSRRRCQRRRRRRWMSTPRDPWHLGSHFCRQSGIKTRPLLEEHHAALAQLEAVSGCHR